jgi:hypothetical protein
MAIELALVDFSIGTPLVYATHRADILLLCYAMLFGSHMDMNNPSLPEMSSLKIITQAVRLALDATASLHPVRHTPTSPAVPFSLRLQAS